VGVSLVGLCYLLAAEAGLTLTARLLQAAFFVSAVVLLLVFQEDLRRSFERLAILVLRRGRTTPVETAIDVVARAAFALAAVRRGALIVLPGREPIERHVDGGVVLNGFVSEPLLLSLFDPHSPGHDGAVLLDADRVRQFAAHLPLSSDSAQLGPRGTRHAAALGLSERCDATAVVVSEERGTVSLARRGELRALTSAGELAALLRAPATPSNPLERGWRRPLRALRDHAGQMALASVVSLVLWVLVVPGSRVTQATFVVPVQLENVPPGYDVGSVSPRQVKVTVSGVRRALFFLRPDDLHVEVDAFLAQLGRRTFDVPPQSVKAPPGVVVTAVEPGRVDVSVQRSAAPGAGAGPTAAQASP
jgi:DNA integrity scanning protein DisA with diadenylate cyclase activity